MQLLPNEELKFDSDTGGESAVVSDEVINNKYATGEVRIVTEQARYPLNTIVTMVRSDDYNLNPEFQRRHRWDREKTVPVD